MILKRQYLRATHIGKEQGTYVRGGLRDDLRLTLIFKALRQKYAYTDSSTTEKE